MIHLYAFVRGLRRIQPGLDARPFGSLGAVTGAEERGSVAARARRRAPARPADAVLPVRFGERFEDGG